MARRHHSPEQIAAALRQVEAGVAVTDLASELGVHENTLHLWKKTLWESRHA
jgi:transposase-like protein